MWGEWEKFGINALKLVFGQRPVRILAGPSAILPMRFREFSQLLQQVPG